MDLTTSLLTVAVASIVTFLIRLLPFILFGKQDRTSPILTDLNRLLPAAIIAVLVIYCLKEINFTSLGSFLPQLIGVAIVAGLHLWKRNNLLSIGVGTICYMVLVQTVF